MHKVGIVSPLRRNNIYKQNGGYAVAAKESYKEHNEICTETRMHSLILV